jgi:hypothetical protein
VYTFFLHPQYFIFSKFDLTQHITSLIYRQGKGCMFRSLKRFFLVRCLHTGYGDYIIWGVMLTVHLHVAVNVKKNVEVDWFVVWVTPMHLGLKLQALCAPLLVPSVNSRGAPRHAGVRDLC